MTNTKTTKRRINQADCLRMFSSNESSYKVGETELQPGTIQIVQYSTRLVGPITPERARKLAAELLAAADALEGVQS